MKEKSKDDEQDDFNASLSDDLLKNSRFPFRSDYFASTPSSTIGPLRLSTEGVDTKVYSELITFDTERINLIRQIDKLTEELEDEKMSGEQKTQKIEELKAKQTQMSIKDKIRFLIERVNLEAQKRLIASKEFRNSFLSTKECASFVLSVDIRRSTEMMLKARTPEGFARFIHRLCSSLAETITDNYGIFDKFTGDGVLAFFPDFYTGEDAPYYVMSVADKCHKIFREHYRESRNAFNSVLTDVGLGVGIDFGVVHLVMIANALTVVGEPVVYACRLSGAPPGCTYVNQPAFERLAETIGKVCFIEDAEISIKNEGSVLAYNVHLNNMPYSPTPPDWLKTDERINTLSDSKNDDQ